MKVCNTCHDEKEYNRFDKNVNRLDGHVGRCKSCRVIAQKALKEKEKLDISELMLKWGRAST